MKQVEVNRDEWIEIQVDRIVGPTHHFGGAGVGNVASQSHAGETSNPAAAAIQGLEKMRLVGALGVPQWILPPQIRPDFNFLRGVGFAGDKAERLKRARHESAELFSAALSSSAMWTANAATVTVAKNSLSGNFETAMTVANLSSSLHRAIEPNETSRDLRAVFGDTVRLHSPLVAGVAMRDEGAANHMRLMGGGIQNSFDVFVYGDQPPTSRKFYARQTLASFEVIARRHGLAAEAVCFLKQHPDAIDAGAFHNDVVTMSHHDLMIHHELAFADSEAAMAELEAGFRRRTGQSLTRIEVSAAELSIGDAIATYLFNSQIVSLPDHRIPPAIICPIQVERHPSARKLVVGWQQDGLFSQVVFVDLGQSMSGGGGPACLRLRVPIPSGQLEAVNPRSRWTDKLDRAIERIIRDGYPTSVTLDDLASIEFVQHAGRVRDQIAIQLGREILS
ncbi:N-succinylarginine dihydrolase [Rubripirellula reticaptiva]|uniref:N-succinylarginine dihydrolase n=1 Tax=Rubripirellula reticaptiva TaxID=2528013 RepID=A0A5C6F3R6_9BACT|nr:N-succinylarginine dihydrolase [Rubripirellula reticaptiva]TWU55795.1 N-succinylarginine dihydrolase [Rubripirellula reticaptiva]